MAWHRLGEPMAAELMVMLGGFLVVGLMVGFAFGVAWERRAAAGVKGRLPPTNEELRELWNKHGGHPEDFAADVLERWGGWPPGVLGQGGNAGVEGKTK